MVRFSSTPHHRGWVAGLTCSILLCLAKVWEKKHEKAAPKHEVKSYNVDGVKVMGLLRPMSEGMEPGCIELSVEADQVVEKKTILHHSRDSVRAGESQEWFNFGSDKLSVKAASKQDKEGNEYLTLVGGAKKKKKSEEDSLWDDLFDCPAPEGEKDGKDPKPKKPKDVAHVAGGQASAGAECERPTVPKGGSMCKLTKEITVSEGTLLQCEQMLRSSA